jgi:hypothetical protein
MTPTSLPINGECFARSLHTGRGAVLKRKQAKKGGGKSFLNDLAAQRKAGRERPFFPGFETGEDLLA